MTEPHSHSARWVRGLAEVVTIVLGISIALGADAWWDGRVDRHREAQALERLNADFTRAAEVLQSSRADHVAEQVALKGMLQLILAGGNPAGSYEIPDSVLWGIYRTSRYSPPLGAVSSLISSGEIGLIRDDALRAELTYWLEAVERVNTAESDERRVYEEFQLPTVFEFVAYVSVGFRLGADGYAVQSPSESDYPGLLTSLPFENLIDWRIGKKEQILQEYDSVNARLRVILAVLSEATGAS